MIVNTVRKFWEAHGKYTNHFSGRKKPELVFSRTTASIQILHNLTAFYAVNTVQFWRFTDAETCLKRGEALAPHSNSPPGVCTNIVGSLQHPIPFYICLSKCCIFLVLNVLK